MFLKSLGFYVLFLDARQTVLQSQKNESSFCVHILLVHVNSLCFPQWRSPEIVYLYNLKICKFNEILAENIKKKLDES